MAARSPEIPFVRQLGRFLDAVRCGDRDAVFCTAAQAARTVAIVAAARRSLATDAEAAVEDL